ncbi:MAG: class D sortase [Peptococcaceae bacterium]|nr:class D sortase [Peptococcaceae bacterium]
MPRKLLALLLIVIGISIVGYPTARDLYYDYQQKKITEAWQAGLEQLDREPLEPVQESKEEPVKAVLDLSKEMEGLLIIDKINLRVPILTGINKRNLDLAVASVENTAKAGEVGNYVLAGHNSHTYGLLFSRLDELTVGDRIVVQAKEQEYVYTVTESMIVQAEDVQVLRPDGEKRLITLVTCDYSTKPYRRLIVKGEMES